MQNIKQSMYETMLIAQGVSSVAHNKNLLLIAEKI